LPNKGLQATLNSLRSFLASAIQRRLKPSVDMTSDVKSREQLFTSASCFFSLVYRKSRSQ
jgi:hypothetical protein